MKQAFRLFLPLLLILALLVSCGKEEAPPDPTELAPKDFSLRGLEPIRFIAANRGVCFGKNSCNIRILLQIFALHPLTICSL